MLVDFALQAGHVLVLRLSWMGSSDLFHMLIASGSLLTSPGVSIIRSAKEQAVSLVYRSKVNTSFVGVKIVYFPKVVSVIHLQKGFVASAFIAKSINQKQKKKQIVAR